jgi:hypothetical protein
MTRAGILALCTSCTLAIAGVGAVAVPQASAMKMNLYTSEGHVGLEGGHELWYSTRDSSRWSLTTTLGKAKLVTNSLETSGTTFEGVVMEGVACHSAGAAEGVVNTEPTTLELGYVNAKKKEVGIEERPTTGTLYAEFTCGANTVEIHGAHIGLVTPANKTIKAGESLTIENAISTATGRDAITHFEHGPETMLEEQVTGEGFLHEEGVHDAVIEDPGTFAPEEGTVKIKANGKTAPQFEIKEKKAKK